MLLPWQLDEHDSTIDHNHIESGNDNGFNQNDMFNIENQNQDAVFPFNSNPFNSVT